MQSKDVKILLRKIFEFVIEFGNTLGRAFIIIAVSLVFALNNIFSESQILRTIFIFSMLIWFARPFVFIILSKRNEEEDKY